MTNTTRMRMTKTAAALIHDWRDEHGHETNAEAIHDLFADYWATESKVYHLEGFKSRYDEMRFRHQANARALVDSQKMLHEKDAELTEVKSKLIASINSDLVAFNMEVKRQERINTKIKRQLKNRSEWLALFVVSNVVGWGLAITLLAG